jgi:ABC-2 type transport system ATP-binding protein
MNSTNAIEIHGLVKQYYKGPLALNGVDLEVKKGDFFALLGSNGAGKTTIINILVGLVNKTSGQAKVFGYDVVTQAEQARRQIGVVPQEFNFSIFEKVIDIVCTQAGYFAMPWNEALVRAEEVLKQLDLWDKRDVVSMKLSGGMKRRLLIARALMHRPRLLILDEPTAGVDVELRHGMWEYLRALNASGTTILLTTHYLEEVEQMCKNVAIIKQGEIVKNDSVRHLISTLETQTYVLTVNKSAGYEKISGFPISSVGENTLEVELGRGNTISNLIVELSKHQIEVLDFRPKNNRLELLFLNLLK